MHTQRYFYLIKSPEKLQQVNVFHAKQVQVMCLLLPGAKHAMHSSNFNFSPPRAGTKTLSRFLSNSSSGNILTQPFRGKSGYVVSGMLKPSPKHSLVSVVWHNSLIC